VLSDPGTYRRSPCSHREDPNSVSVSVSFAHVRACPRLLGCRAYAQVSDVSASHGGPDASWKAGTGSTEFRRAHAPQRSAAAAANCSNECQRAARLDIQCGPGAGSGSPVLSGAVADYRRFQYSRQYHVSLCSVSDRRCGAPAHSSGPQKRIRLAHYRNSTRYGPGIARICSAASLVPNSVEVYCVPRSEWKMQSTAKVWLRAAISKASPTRLVRIWSAIA
jgi:hypothetical protein